jgi:predicted RNase H-like HicB family nuclease
MWDRFAVRRAGETMRYAVVIEKGPTSYGAHVPDLPGCIAVGGSREEVLQLIREAIEFHIEGLREAGEPVPPPSSSVVLVDVAEAKVGSSPRTRQADALRRILEIADNSNAASGGRSWSREEIHER